MADRLHLAPKHRRALEALLREHLPDVEVWAYGSRVNGRSHDGSDLDLVLRGPDLKEIPIGQLGDFWEAVRESNIPFLVEARDWARLPEQFHREIEREYVVMVSREDASLSDGHWASLRLGDVCSKIGSGATPRGGKKAYQTNGRFSLIRSQNVHNDRFSSEGLAFINEKQALQLRNVEVRPDDVLLNITGDSVARVCQVPPNVLPARVNQHVAIIRPDSEKLSARFLRYFLVSPKMQALLLSCAGSGGTRNALTKTMIESLEVYAPIKAREQRAIAHILGTLDDKIELNRRMNETLEAMARALFKSWFVDFDPVRAKMEGRDTGLPKDIADLFPDSVNNQDKPMGWKLGSLSDVAYSPRRGVSPSDVAGNTPYIGLEHMPRRSIALTKWEGASKVTSNKSIFRKGEFLFGKLRPYFHKVGFAPLDGICSTDIVIVVPQSPVWGTFTLSYLTSDDFVDYTDQTSTGTRMPRTSWKTMGQYRIYLPPEQVMRAFQNLMQPLLDLIGANIHESRSLAQARDTLLSKLISGEIRVREAEKMIC